MNINQFAPKSVVLADVKEAAVKYEGTFAELYGLVTDNKVTLVTDRDGNINGMWVTSGATDPMVDAISGENFQRAYGPKPTMTWLGTILTLRTTGKTPECIGDETYTVDGQIYNFDGTAYVAPAPEDEEVEEDVTEQDEDETIEEDLPEDVDISYSELDNPTESGVKKYLRKTYGHYFYKYDTPTMTWEDDHVEVSGIHWGRKLTASELAAIRA